MVKSSINYITKDCTKSNIFQARSEVGAVIHSHEPAVVLASILYKGSEFKIKNQVKKNQKKILTIFSNNFLVAHDQRNLQ